jgi:adenylate cyclase
VNPIAKKQYQTASDYWHQNPADKQWHLVLSGEDPALRQYRQFFLKIPSDPRCKLCNAPFHGVGAPFMRLMGRTSSNLNPQFCKICLETTPVGGAETDLTILFADVRGSTGLAEDQSPAQYGQLINRFYNSTSEVLTHTDAIIPRFAGDAVIGLYVPGFAGHEHARLALEAARQILQKTGHGDQQGPWIPVGVGVHSGKAFVGKIGSEGVADITALGDSANIAARLSSAAGAGEALFSDAALSAAGGDQGDLEQRRLELKGRNEPVDVWALRISPA